MADKKELDDLLVDEEELNEELLVDTVGTYLKIGNTSGELIPEDPFRELDSNRKVAVTLLAQKARFELDMVEQERLSPTEISNLSGVKKGTVYPSVRKLEEEGIAQSDDGQYWIPTVRLKKSQRFIEGDDE